MPDPVLAFGPFELLPAQRLLLEAGRPVRLGSRALDILIELTRQNGAVIGKNALIARVWPGLHVEETNLRVHVTALRKALRDGHGGNRFIASVPGRGYAFVATVVRKGEPTLPLAPVGDDGSRGSVRNLPPHRARAVGRDTVMRDLIAQLSRGRFITLVGPGGIGKTTVAMEVADAVAPALRHGAVFVDLAPLSGASRVAATVATALGLEPYGDDLPRRVGAMLGTDQVLLVLDNCEHLASAAALVAEALLKTAPGILILTTSREALRAEGERLIHLPALEVPPASESLRTAEALRFSGIRLFVERAAASLGAFELSDADAPVVADICRRLDGIPLAIEFAAGRLGAFGLQDLAALLDNRLDLLTRGRRTAVPRHQTLRATLDWSHETLSEAEQRIFRRLAVFSGCFSMEAACEVTHDDSESLDTGNILVSLVEKCLVAADVAGAEPRYRLLETTRAYAHERLKQHGEHVVFARRHAAFHLRVLEHAALDHTGYPLEWCAAYRDTIDDLRAALEWSFGSGGDASLGLALTVAALPVWFGLSLVDESLDWIERALSTIDPAEADPIVRRRRMQLSAAAPGWMRMYSNRRVMRGTAAWETALELAKELGDLDHQMRAIWALWGYRIERADFREALRLAERFCRLAPTSVDTSDEFVGERMAAAALHFLGEQAAARARLDRMLTRYLPSQRRSQDIRFQFDQRVGALITRSRVLWLQGYPDRALHDVADAVARAKAIDHMLVLGSTLVQAACPVALLTGNLDLAERYLGMLRDVAAAHPNGSWRTFSEGYAGEIAIRRGDAMTAGLAQLGAAVGTLREAHYTQYMTSFLAAQAHGAIAANKPTEALNALDDAIGCCDSGGERWASAELERLRGEALLRLGGDDAVARALIAFREALRIAEAQSVLAWELRAATSLALMWQRDGRAAEAIAVLEGVMARFTEGFDTEDLKRASALLEQL